ncbi:hypothetical protein [Mucilaginibacter agri]|uniref:Uncharacterized protein n=1 Tax=Mucilaginibacter agri TaxID=2695265 RepID=A0A965ZDC5_9SPHI|nr:hypothetical protein [Mucilaginibacter agri]NCD68655.1 hypothetical protein [Mucilaginibacter agri]
MGDRNSLSDVYDYFADKLVRFYVVRSVVMLTVVLTLYNGSKVLDNNDIKEKVNSVKAMCGNKRVPPINDFIVDNLFSKHDGYNGEIDSATKRKVLVLLDVIKAKYDEAYQIKVSIVGDLNIDLRYWIFIVPFVFLISSIYAYILAVKIRIIEQVSNANAKTGIENLFDKDVISEFQSQPYKFLKFFFVLAELILIGLFIVSCWSFLANFESDINVLIGLCYLTIFYYGLANAVLIKEKLQHVMDVRNNRSLLRIIWDGVAKKTITMISRISIKRSYIISFISLFITLFTVMSFRTCAWQHEDGDPKGYEMIIKWKFENYGDVINIIYQMCYVSTLLLALIIGLSWFVKEKVTQSFYKVTVYLIVALVNLIFIFLSVYFGVYIFLLDSYWIALVTFLLIAIVIGLLKYRSGNKLADASNIGRKILFACFPFFVLAILNLIFFISEAPGWMVFYWGVIFIDISVFKLLSAFQLFNRTTMSSGLA